MQENDTSSDTLADFVHKHFWKLLDSSVSRNVRHSYDQILRRHILPRLGHYRLHELSDPVFKEFARSIAHLGLVPSTMRSVFEVVRLVLDLAHRERLRDADRVIVPS